MGKTTRALATLATLCSACAANLTLLGDGSAIRFVSESTGRTTTLTADDLDHLLTRVDELSVQMRGVHEHLGLFPPPMLPPSLPPPSPSPPGAPPSSPNPPIGGAQLLARALPLTMAVNAANSPAQQSQAQIAAGYGARDSPTSNYLLGIEYWPRSGTLEMRCYGGSTGDLVLSNSFTLGTSPEYRLTWNQGQFGAHCSGRAISTTDHDRDSHGSTNCVTYSPSVWQYESHGWGWQNTCHFCGLWDGNGEPACFGTTAPSGECWSAGACTSARVELWYTPA